MLFSEADLEQDTVCWGLVSYNAAAECCGWCLANRSSRPVTDMSHDAEWRPTENMTNEISFDVLMFWLKSEMFASDDVMRMLLSPHPPQGALCR